MLETVIDAITPWFEEWGLAIIFVATFLESSLVIASVLPGESVLLLGGFFASPHAPFVEGSDPIVGLGAVIVVAFAGAFLGDLFGYAIGRIGGRAIVRRFGRFFFLPERRLPVLEGYFRRYGMRAVLLGRFAPFLRSIRTLVAGTARMPVWRFALPDVVGAAMWATAIPLIGFVLGESWEVANRYLGAFGFLVFVLLAIGFLMTWRRVRVLVERELASQEASMMAEPGPGSNSEADRPDASGTHG